MSWGFTCWRCGVSATNLSREGVERISQSHRCEPAVQETLDQILSRLVTLEMQVRELRKDNSVQERKSQ